MRLILAILCSIVPLSALSQDPPPDTRVRVVTTLGEFVIRLDPGRSPRTVESFLKHVDSGFYEDTIFHRVIAGFVAQGGGYTAELELKPIESNVFNESGNGLSNMRGTVGMARANEAHSGTTQFYVNLADNLDLNPRPTRWGYAVFGTVEEGMDVVDQIGSAATAGGGPFENSVPVTPIVIESVERLP